MAHPMSHTAAVRKLGAAFVCLAVLAVAAPVAGQTPDLPGFDATDTELTLPPSGSTAIDPPPAEVEPIPSPVEAGSPVGELGAPYETTLEPLPAHHDLLSLTGDYPAVTESSGTWLNRGFWYADTEVVMMARTWNRHDVVLMQEFDQIQNQLVLAQGVFTAPSLVQIQQQLIGNSSPGYDGSIRLTLGRFLFRDIKNRDHTAELVFMGGNQLSEQVAAEAQLTDEFEGIFLVDGNVLIRDNRGLHIPSSIDGSTPLNIDSTIAFPSFDESLAMSVDYSSRFLNWEANYNVNGRLDKDRMELLPSGEWVRRSSSNLTYNYAAGLRYFDLEEQLDWRASTIRSLGVPQGDGTVDDSPDGALRAHTTNDLYGMQLGAGITYQSDRWNVSVSTKQGFYINDARARRILTYTADNGADANNYNLDLHENGVSYIGTASVVARYHLRPNLSLRAGWEVMFITGLAFAPDQVNFNPAVGQQLHLSGDAVYHGVNFGAEMYW